MSTSLVTIHIVAFFSRCLRLVNMQTCRRVTTSGSITDRSGPILGRLATRGQPLDSEGSLAFYRVQPLRAL